MGNKILYLQCRKCAGAVSFKETDNPKHCIECGGRMVIYDPVEAINDRVNRSWLDGGGSIYK